jgi:hypothetical protein
VGRVDGGQGFDLAGLAPESSFVALAGVYSIECVCDAMDVVLPESSAHVVLALALNQHVEHTGHFFWKLDLFKIEVEISDEVEFLLVKTAVYADPFT